MDQRTLMHMSTELVVIGGMCYYFTRKNNELRRELNDLRNEMDELREYVEALSARSHAPLSAPQVHGLSGSFSGPQSLSGPQGLSVDQVMREQAERHLREQSDREQAERQLRDQAVREQAERQIREQAARDQAMREQAMREQVAREKAARERPIHAPIHAGASRREVGRGRMRAGGQGREGERIGTGGTKIRPCQPGPAPGPVTHWQAGLSNLEPPGEFESPPRPGARRAGLNLPICGGGRITRAACVAL